MDIQRENIVEESAITNIDWIRPHTPYTEDNKEVKVDSVEFEIKHNGIEKLECNIDCETENIMCFVHFNHSTKQREGIYFSVWESYGLSDSPIIVELSENETEMLYDYALEKIKLKFLDKIGEINMEEKINQIRELVREIKSYDNVLYMYEGDKIDLEIKKQELWDLLQKL